MEISTGSASSSGGGASVIEFLKDGVPTSVSEDTVTPANSVPLPVTLYGLTGQINVTAGDLNVQLSDQGANPDVTKIGDGTTRLGITLSNEAKVADANARASLVSIDGKTPALGQALMAASVPVVIASNQSAVPISSAELTSLAANQESGDIRVAYDERVFAYVGATDDIDTITYKLSGVTVATQTFSYDGSNRLSGIVTT